MISTNSSTLLEGISEAKQMGFTEEFMYRDKKIIGRNNMQSYKKEDCYLIEYFIHEGMSNPADQSILFLIECADGTQGVLSSAYGTYADTELIDFCLSKEKKN
jgi:hypothetical protein